MASKHFKETASLPAIKSDIDLNLPQVKTLRKLTAGDFRHSVHNWFKADGENGKYGPATFRAVEIEVSRDPIEGVDPALSEIDLLGQVCHVAMIGKRDGDGEDTTRSFGLRACAGRGTRETIYGALMRDRKGRQWLLDITEMGKHDKSHPLAIRRVSDKLTPIARLLCFDGAESTPDYIRAPMVIEGVNILSVDLHADDATIRQSAIDPYAKILGDWVDDRLAHEDLIENCPQYSSRAYAPEALVLYWRQALARLASHSLFEDLDFNPDLIDQGYHAKPLEVQVFLCSRENFDAISGRPGGLGCHLLETPDDDPFKDATPYADAYRVLVVSDRDEFLDLARQDDDNGREEAFLKSYLTTVFHEIAHAHLFALNAACLTPAKIDDLSNSGAMNNDVFDCSTGYGIRTLPIHGQEMVALSAQDALELMEIYAEETGATLCDFTLVGDLDPDRFLDAFDVPEDYAKIGHDGSNPETSPANP